MRTPTTTRKTRIRKKKKATRGLREKDVKGDKDTKTDTSERVLAKQEDASEQMLKDPAMEPVSQVADAALTWQEQLC